MKLILSRKGFDSANGGCPSPILDGRLCSLPIPDAGAPTQVRRNLSVQWLVDRSNCRRPDARPSHAEAMARISIRICAATRLRAPRDGVRSSARPRPRRVISRARSRMRRSFYFLRMLSARREGRRPRSASSAMRQNFTLSSDGSRSGECLAQPMASRLKSRGPTDIRISPRPSATKTTRSISRATVSRRLASELEAPEPSTGSDLS